MIEYIYILLWIITFLNLGFLIWTLNKGVK
jgi:hypothetical protein